MTKKILPLLLCYVLMTSQVFAISGGPVYGGRGINPVGIYSGVITVTSVKQFQHDATGANVIDPNTGQALAIVDNSTVSLGLFSLGVPTTSVATGAFVQFVNGDVFIGNIIASIDADRGVLTGIVQGTSSYSVSSTGTSTGTTTTTTYVVLNRAAGKVNANISANRQGSLASATVRGTANLIVNTGGDRVGEYPLAGTDPVTGQTPATQGALVQNYVLNCTVTGFRQSTAYSSVNSLGLNTSGSN